MAKYENDVKELLKFIGGKENIQAVSHCMTRMRFVLVDEKKADTTAIEKLQSVKGTFTQAGQYQVIIGNDVSTFYNEFTAFAGIEGVSKEVAKQAAVQNQNVLQRVMSALGEIFAPIIPALICGGLILGFRNVIGEINFFNHGTQSLTDISQFLAGLYSFLWLIGEAVFHLLPVGIVWSITKKMGTTQILGIVLGLTLVSPQLLNGFAVAGTAVADIPVWDFGFAKVQMIGYQGQVIAAIMAGFVLVYLEKFFRKYTPAVISMIVVPFCSLLPAVIIAHTLVGPIGWKIGNAIAEAVYSGLTSNYGFLFAGVFGFCYAPVVMTGLHHMTNAIDTTLSSAFGGTILWPMIALSNIAQGSSVLAMSVLQKKNEKAQQVNVPALISCYLGVTEPALFGVNLKYGFPLICGMIGSAIAGMISVGTGVQAFSIGVGGLPAILSIFTKYWMMFLLCVAIAIVVPFLLTFLIGKKKLTEVERNGAIDFIESEDKTITNANEIDMTNATSTSNIEKTANIANKTNINNIEKVENKASRDKIENTDQTVEKSLKKGELKAILSGTIIPLEEVKDNVFSQKILGEGVAFEPENNTVYAPADGTISVVMKDSGHACGMTLENGMELLIHVGIDTVNMNGDGFQLFVNTGDHVQCGDPLISFDPDKIQKAGFQKTTMLIVTEVGNATEIQYQTGIHAKEKETVAVTYQHLNIIAGNRSTYDTGSDRKI